MNLNQSIKRGKCKKAGTIKLKIRKTGGLYRLEYNDYRYYRCELKDECFYILHDAKSVGFKKGSPIICRGEHSNVMLDIMGFEFWRIEEESKSEETTRLDN